MAKTLISRLDAENIVRAAVDPETHEATGDVYDSVNDVSYPFGGGGGDTLKNPVITLNVVLSGVASATVMIYDLEDGYFFQTSETVTESSTIESYTDGMDMMGETAYILPTNLSIADISDTVNCTAADSGGMVALIVTDPTQPASATFTYSGEN